MPTRVRLLHHDPDLAAGLTPEEREFLEGRLLVPALAFDGPGVVPEGVPAEPLVVLEGMLVREVRLSDRRMAQILGPGDLISFADQVYDLPCAVRWTVLTPTTVAVLNGTFMAAAARWPALGAAVRRRHAEQGERQSLLLAVAALPRVEQRLLGLLWMVASRWGRMTPDGAVVGLPLTHALLAELVGAGRSTVTLALGVLAEEGLVRRAPNGGYVLAPGSDETLRAAGVEERPAVEPRPRTRPVTLLRAAPPERPEDVLVASATRLRGDVRLTMDRARQAIERSRRVEADTARIRGVVRARRAGATAARP